MVPDSEKNQNKLKKISLKKSNQSNSFDNEEIYEDEEEEDEVSKIFC